MNYIRGAWWALRSLRIVRRQLPTKRLDEVEVPAPPVVSEPARNAVTAILRVRKATCLEQAFLQQRWASAKGIDKEVVIGVTAPSSGFRAHAWLEGDDPCHSYDFVEIRRQAARQ